ncbi:MAG: Xaa-Pro peptidase family protein [Chloroflexota bacterium]
MEIHTTAAHPTTTEIVNRIEKVQANIRTQGLDAYVCHDPDNIFYLTNFANFVHERPFILIIPAAGSMTFLMPKLEEPHVRTRSVGEMEFVHYFEFPAPAGETWRDRLQEILTGFPQIGIESQCPIAVVNEIPGTPRVTDIVEDVRLIKSDYEVGRIAHASQLMSEGHRLLLKEARPGRMVIDVHSLISSTLTRKLLLDNPESNMLNTKFSGVAQPPKIAHDPHNFTNTFMQFTEGGPHVTIVAGTANGYGGEIERTFFFGHVPEVARKPFNDMLAARALAFELLKPGIVMDELDRQVNDLLKARGYGDFLLHRTGHGFGVTNHEAPFLAEGDMREVEARMVFSIEPGIYIPGVGGFRFSDTVLVTEKGNISLTDGPETLDELTLAGKRRFKDRVRIWTIGLATRGKKK